RPKLGGGPAHTPPTARERKAADGLARLGDVARISVARSSVGTPVDPRCDLPSFAFVTLCRGERVGRCGIGALTVSFASGGHKKLHASLTRSSETPKNSPSQ